MKYAAVLAALVGAVTACTVADNYEITFYGYPDNSPPGADIAYDCGRGYTAGGSSPLLICFFNQFSPPVRMEIKI